MEAIIETANFRGDDADCLVAASLACPACLSGEVDWALAGEHGADARATCRCRSCDHRRTVFLLPDQALRLTLHDRRPLDPTPRPEHLDPALL